MILADGFRWILKQFLAPQTQTYYHLDCKYQRVLIAATNGMVQHSIRELPFLMLGTGMEEFLEGCQIFLPCLIGIPNILLMYNEALKFQIQPHHKYYLHTKCKMFYFLKKCIKIPTYSKHL